MKSQVAEIVTIVVLLFVASISIMVSFSLYSKIYEKKDTFGEAGSEIIESGAKAYNIWDAVFVLIFTGINAGLIISSFFIRTHPIFFILFALSTAVIYFVVPMFSNLYTSAVDSFNQTQGIDFAEKYPKMHWIMTNLPTLGAVTLAILLISLFAKPLLTGEGGI